MTKSTKDITVIISVLVLVALILGIGPILTIMSLNVLFSTGIAINFYSWLSTVWLMATTFGGIQTAIKSK